MESEQVAGPLEAGTSLSALAGALLDIAQPRITGLVVATAGAGYVIGAAASVEPTLLLGLCVGTALSCGGTNALNQWLERDRDGRMKRTRSRPLPSGRLSPAAGLAWGAGLAICGVAVLWLGVSAGVGALGLLTVLSYLFLYTPLKTRTPWATCVGTLPGALPVLGGWVAATGDVGLTGLALFGMLAAWQLPHFFALEWTSREDYRRAGFATPAVVDPSGRRSGRQALVGAALLLAVSLLPLVPGRLGAVYGVVAVLAGLGVLLPAAAFLRRRSPGRARRLFAVSLAYLPVTLGAGVLDVLL